MKELFYGYDNKNIYLDNGASTLSLKSVKDKIDKFLLTYGSVHRGFGENSIKSTNSYENARDYILEKINGNKEKHSLIFTANTTDSINKFVHLFDWKKDDVVLVSDIEHSSNWLPYLKVAKVKMIETDNFVITPENVEKAIIKNKPRCIALGGASNITGYVIDIKKIYEICKRYNVLFLLDASQYAPHFKLDINDCDVLFYCGHKMYAPFGIGILAGKKEILEKHTVLSFTGGGNVIYAGDDEIIMKETPYLHETGTPNSVGAIAIAQAHKVLYDEIGFEEVELHNKRLIKEIDIGKEKLVKNGYNVYFNEIMDKRTPILVIDNQKMSNQKTCELLNSNIGLGTDFNVFVREGAFCTYKVLEMLKPNLIKEEKIINGKLNTNYSLIRLSAGLINDELDIWKAIEKLCYINSKY